MKFATRFENSIFVFSPISMDDAVILYDAVSSECFPCSLPLARINTVAKANQWCSDRVLDWEEGKCFVWTCRKTSDNAVVGQVTIFPRDKDLALAYWVTPKFWGLGLATQMCKFLLDHIRLTGYQGEIWAGVHLWNNRSASVLKKLGFIETDVNIETSEYRLTIKC